MPSKVAENVNFSRYTQRQSRLHTRYSYDTVGTEFGSQPQFEEFDYGVSNMSITRGEYYTQPPSYSSLFSSYPSNIWTSQPFENASTDNFADEPPLMEELGINFDSILQKTVTVLNPLTETNTAVLQEADLSGPFVFCLIFGTFLLFNGKLHFGYMYGIGMLGCLAMYALLNLMSDSSVSIGSTISVLGYCLMPMIVLSGLSILSLRGMTGTILSVVTVLWCSLSASKLFVTALDMDQQQLLIAYPCALLYGIFALLTVF